MSRRTIRRAGALSPVSAEPIRRTGAWQGAVRRARAAVTPAWPVLVAATLPLLAFVLQGGIGLDLADEGFLWYGVQRVLQGEVPLRDFQAYDIGRYYGAAAWLRLVGDDSLLALRGGHALVAALTVGIATALVRGHQPAAAGRRGAAAVATVMAGVVFTLWMVPDYKVADSFAAVLLCAALAALVQAPSARRHGLYGLVLGVCGMLGINHAAYGVAGFMLFAVWRLAVQRQGSGWQEMAALAAGAFLGYAPGLAFHLFVPGFFAAFVDGLRQLVEAGTTNLKLPWPPLDAMLQAQPDRFTGISKSLLALAFIATPLFWLVCAPYLLRRADTAAVTPPPAFVAGALLSLPYAHYAWSRADTAHLAVSVLPLCIAILSAPWWPRQLRLPVTLLGLAWSAFIALPLHAGFAVLRGYSMVPVSVQGTALQVRPGVAVTLRMIEGLAAIHATQGRAFYAGPYWPGAYAVMGQRAPVHEIYALFPASSVRQQREIARLASTDLGFAAISSDRVDRRTDLGFDRTHPQLLDYLRRCLPLRNVVPATGSKVEILLAAPAGAQTPRGNCTAATPVPAGESR